MFFKKKLITLPDTSHKYHVNRGITLKYIQTSNPDIFFSLTVYMCDPTPSFEKIFSLIKQNWNYSDYGILDRTHLRFFTPNSFEEFANQNGWKVLVIEPINSYGGIKQDIFNLLRYMLPKNLINYLSFGHIYKLKSKDLLENSEK